MRPPWAALCAFDGVATASLLGYDGFVVGHERSAAEGNGVFFNGREVNHQFDKSLAWEAALRSYLGRLSSVSYVSPLQPLWDLQVAGVFCLEDALRPFYSLFRSCNDSGSCDRAVCRVCQVRVCLLRPDPIRCVSRHDALGLPRFFTASTCTASRT